MQSDPLTLQKILQLGYAAYERSHALREPVRRAVGAMLGCRTALLGGHIHACPEGHLERVWYHSCRHRMYPQCAWLQIERWLAQQVPGAMLARASPRDQVPPQGGIEWPSPSASARLRQAPPAPRCR